MLSKAFLPPLLSFGWVTSKQLDIMHSCEEKNRQLVAHTQGLHTMMSQIWLSFVNCHNISKWKITYFLLDIPKACIQVGLIHKYYVVSRICISTLQEGFRSFLDTITLSQILFIPMWGFSICYPKNEQILPQKGGETKTYFLGICKYCFSVYCKYRIRVLLVLLQY